MKIKGNGKGRKKKPDTLKVLSGTNQPCRMSSDSVQYLNYIEIPSAPEWLSEDGKIIFENIKDETARLGILNSQSIYLFWTYCNCLGKYIGIEKELSNGGLMKGRIHVIKNSSNVIVNSKPSALHKLSMEYLMMAKNLASELGLTPTSSMKIISKSKGKESKLSKYFNV